MITENQNNFEEEWRKAFESSELAPPADMWNRIERELDKKEKRPFFFFIRPNLSAGIAAALVVALAGFWYFGSSSKQNNIAQSRSSKSAVSSRIGSKNISDSKQIEVAQSPQTSLSTHEDKNIGFQKSDLPSDDKKSTIEQKQSLINKPLNSAQIAQANTSVYHQESEGMIEKHLSKKTQTSSTQGINQVTPNEKGTLALYQIKNKGFHLFVREFYLGKNKLLFDTYTELAVEETIAQNSEGKFWLGFQSGVAPFKPSMDLSPLNSISMKEAEIYADYSNLYEKPQSTNNPPIVGAEPPKGDVFVSQPINNLKRGTSSQIGLNWGYQLNKHFSLESGLKYLRGNSVLESNTYSFSKNGEANTFFANYLSNTNKSNNTVIADASQGISRYEYLILPIQIGYQINLSPKVSLQISSGLTADIFLQNTLINDNGMLDDKNIFKSSNSFYKPLNFSTLQGLRGAYKLNNRWQAIISGTYQQSLTSTTSSDILKMKLKLFGLNYGLSYRF